MARGCPSLRPDNHPSARVAERLGERLEGPATLFGQDALVYPIDRARWETAGPG